MHDDDIRSRQIDPRIGAGYRGIVPLRDLAEEDASESFGREVQRGVNARKIICGDDCSKNRGEVLDPKAILVLIRLHLLVVHGSVGGAKVHRAIRNLLDAGSGTNGSVIDFNVSMGLVVLVEPFRVNGVGERRSRAVDEQPGLRVGYAAHTGSDQE